MRPARPVAVLLLAAPALLAAQRQPDHRLTPPAPGASVIVVDSTLTRDGATLADLLAEQPGVVVRRPSGAAGAGAKVYLRGPNGAFDTGDPLLVVDGTYAEETQAALGLSTGGQQPSRLDDLRLEDVATVELLRGPAAAARYGANGAAGVIVVTTRRGTAGAARWRGFASTGPASGEVPWAASYGMRGHFAAGDSSGFCPNTSAASGQCTQTTLVRRDVARERGLLSTGLARAAGASVSGTRGVRYYASAALDGTDGALASSGAQRATGRVNASRDAGPVHLSLATGWALRRVDVADGGAAATPIVVRALVASPLDTTRVSDGRRLGSAPDAPVRDEVGHLEGALAVDWAARPWLDLHGAVSADGLHRGTTYAAASLAPNGTDTVSVREQGQLHETHATYELRATAHAAPFSALRLATTATLRRRDRRGTDERDQSTRVGTLPASVGFETGTWDGGHEELALEQGVALGQVLELGGGLLHVGPTQHTGGAGGARWYPSASGRWHVRDGGGAMAWLPGLDLRAAYGELPDWRVFEQLDPFLPIAGSSPWYPERTRERELGADVRLGTRAALAVTHYRRETVDAVMAGVSSGSSGYEIIGARGGRVRNAGLEAALGARLADGARVRWDASLSAWTNRNRVVRLATAPVALASGDFAWARILQQRGHPLGDLAVAGVTWNDADHDGLLSPSEVTAGALASAGSVLPTSGGSLRSTLRVGARLTLSAWLDRQAGAHRVDGTAALQCAARTCRAANDPTASLAAQADALASAWAFASAGMAQDAGYVKLRELSLRVALPDAWAARLRARAAAVSLVGRNLATWTPYRGVDPELNAAGPALFGAGELATIPLPRAATLRLDLGF